MIFASSGNLRRRLLAGFSLLAALGFSPTAQAQLFFPWGPPERAEPAPGLGPRQVAEVLAREGARMIGRPRQRGDEIFAVGRDRRGAQKRFILDAVSGEVLDVALISPPRRENLDERPRRRVREETPAAPQEEPAPRSPLPPPEHAPHGGDDAAAAPAAEPPGPAARAPAPPVKGDDPDAALSPVKPLPGAPRVEPLPKE